MAGAGNPRAKYGIHPGEWLDVLFDLQGEKTFDHVIAAIHQGFTNPEPWTGNSLRIGIHVTDFASGGSESFIMVPVPGAALLGFLGLGYAGMKLRRRV